MNKLTRYGLIMGAGVALLGLGSISAAFAAETTATDSLVLAQVEEAQVQTAQVETETPADEDALTRREGRRGMGFLDRDAMKAAVADVLGITVEELEAAREAGQNLSEIAEAQGVSLDDVEAAIYDAKLISINDAVVAGDITEEQAAEIIARLELSQIARDIFDRDEMKAIVADVLGVSVEELEAAREDGTARELFEDADREAIEAALEVYRAEQIQDALDQGLITQEQADELSEGNFGRRGHGRGGRGGNGNGPRGGGAPADAPAQDA